MKLDRLAEAERLFRSVADRRCAVFGKSAALAVDLLQLGRAELALGKFAAARDVLGEARPMAIDNLGPDAVPTLVIRSEEHTSELQSLMRISYAVFCLKKKN